ncbi:MAG TPA: molybdopterin cofactor-binding domain-containing protein [Steroidobacter sp.]
MSATEGAISRRHFLVASVLGGGGLLLGFTMGTRAQAQASAPTPNAFIRIDQQGRVTLTLPYVEMGQGAYTSQAQIVAEELEVDPATLILEAAPANEKLYASPLFLGQITGGSGSLRGAWMSMRTAGAAARLMLIEAAARRWQVRSSTCRAENGRVIHASSGRSFGYGQIASDAARSKVPQSPPLKEPKQFRVVGKPVARVDTPEKITGRAIYGIDVRPPGVRYAFVAASPVFNGKVGAIDDRATLAINGVRQVVRTADAIAIIADNTWAARKGLTALKVTWTEDTNSSLSTANLVAAADTALDRTGLVAEDIGDTNRAESAAAQRYEQIFRLPMLAHATMEPLNCTAHVTANRCDVWCGNQALGRAQRFAAEAAGLHVDQVNIYNHVLGGGFGRRLEADYIAQAVSIAKQVDGPVKVMWSREEDFQHDYYRYINHSRVTVGLDANGQPVSWRHRIAGPNIMARFLPIYQKNGIDLDIVDCATGPYDIPNVHVDFVRNEAPQGCATGNWRGVGPSRNVFIVESVIDELARRAGRDPIAYRLALMSKFPRQKAVLEIVAAKSGWETPLPHTEGARRGRGVAVFSGFGSHLALVAQIVMDAARQVRVERVVCAIDAGMIVNPDIVKAQIEGGINFGISAALREQITIANGRVEQANFDTYQLLRIHEAPAIEVHIVASNEDPGGVGEPGTSGAIAAVANAVSAATGERITRLPIQQALPEGTRA